MIEITLTDFVDFVSKAGTPKLTVVKNVKKHHIDGYDPQTDFYRAIRNGIVEMHQKGKPKDALDNLLLGLTDKKKQTAYPELVAGYKKFLGKKRYVWFTPPKHKWEHAGLAISVNPEVGLEFDGVRHVVKLYFKAPKLGKIQMDIVTHLMTTFLPQSHSKVTSFDMLDIRNAKLIPGNPTDPSLTALLEGEAASFAQIYKSL
jgi:hypothetical protein